MTRTYACSLNYESMPINDFRDTERHGERGNLHVQNRLSCPLDLSPIHADGQNRDPVSHRIHRDQRSELKVPSRHFNGGQQLSSHVTWQNRLRPKLDNTGCRQPPDGEQGSEIQVLSENDLKVVVGVGEDHAIRGIRLADVDPMDCVMTRGYQEADPPRAQVHVNEEPHAEIEISISSTRHAAYERACITSCSSR